jgi:hypothetical protein
MIDHESRYAAVGTLTLELASGPVVYLKRRFLPQGERLSLLATVPVAPGERIDAVAYRTLGDPLAFWRICDANDAMDPQAMLADAARDPGRFLNIPLPQN